MAIVTDIYVWARRRFLDRIRELVMDHYPATCRLGRINEHGVFVFGLALCKEDEDPRGAAQPPAGCYEDRDHRGISPAFLCVTQYVASRLTDIRPTSPAPHGSSWQAQYA